MAPPSTLARSVLRLRRALPASMAAVAIIIAVYMLAVLGVGFAAIGGTDIALGRALEAAR